MNAAMSKLLVVDGEEQVGYEVRTARAAEEALKTWGPSTNFDAVISETVLPGMNGHEFASHIAVHCPGTPVIFVCSFDMNCEACPHQPRCPWVGKPFDPKDVVQTVAEGIKARDRESN
jgi:DNA-binding NtrC family response regulator